MADKTATKSRRKSAPKVDESAEPTGIKKALQNPVIILVLVILGVLALIGAIWGLAEFLSGG
jgi:membrane-bound ClpP family serine protease